MANWIGAPYNISLEYGLAFYGLKPAYAEEVTCVFSKRTRISPPRHLAPRWLSGIKAQKNLNYYYLLPI